MSKQDLMKTQDLKNATGLPGKKKGPLITTNAARCTGCLACELSCSLRHEKGFNPSGAAIEIRRLVNSANEYTIAFKNTCDNCGICVRYCTYGALSQEKQRS